MLRVVRDNLSIRTRITIYAVTLTVAALALIVLLSYTLFRSQLKQSIAKHQTAQINSLAFQVDDRLKLAIDQLQRIADSISSEQIYNPDRLQHILDGKREEHAFFDNGFLIIGADLRLIVDSPFVANRRGKDYSFRAYAVRALKTGRPYIADPYLPVIPPNVPSILFTAPIKRADGKVIGILAGRHNLLKGSFLESISKTTVSDVGYLYVISKNRTIVVHPNKNRIMEEIKPGANAGIDRAINEGFDGSMENLNSNATSGITSFKHLKNAEWIIASHVPTDDIYKPLRSVEKIISAAFACIAFLAALIIWRVLGGIMMPLQLTIDHIWSMSEKRGKERLLPDVYEGELGRLATVFNTMIEEFDDQQETLRLSEETYRIVAEFTSEVAFWREADGRIMFISPNCLDLTGYTESEFYAQPELLDRIVHPDYQEYWKGHLHEIDQNTGKIQSIELKIVTKSGDELLVMHLCHQVFDNNGKYLGRRGNFTDITPLKKMQKLLLDQKNFAEDLINKAAVPIFVLDTNHRIVAWNNAIEDMTGYKAEEMIGTNHQWAPFYPTERPVLGDLVLAADNLNIEELYATHRISQHVRGGQQSEGWLENVGGTRRYLLFDAAPVYTSNGIKMGVIETLLDMTDRKLAEDQLRKLSRAVSENPCTIVITDSKGTIEYVNSKFCEITGYSEEEAIGQNPRILKSGDMPPEDYVRMWQDISHGKTWHGEFHNKKKNGELYWEIASISAVMDNVGEITNYLAVKEDITERKNSEIELAAAKDELQRQHKELNKIFKQMEKAKREWETTLDCISDMVLMCDTWGKIKRCNRPVTTLTGLKYDEILDKNWMSVLSGIGFQAIDFDGEHGNLLHPESGRFFEVNVFPINGSENPIQSGTVVSIHDMTALKAMNSKLEEAYSELQHTQSQILQQEKMASIGQLAAGVAHEINNPMGFISSNLSSLGKYMEKISAFNAALMEAVQTGGDTATLATLNELRKKMKIDFILGDISGLLSESRDGAERVRRIVQDLKSFSHVDEVECKPFSINECLTSTLNMARNEIKYVADVEQELDPDLPLLNCYPQQLNQVFMNILVNAGHAMEGGHGVIKISTMRESDDIVVRISDTGKGIPPENISRIFEPFFTTKEVGKGTGLGLSISYDIIKKHGGVMNVESVVGVGTTFIIRLPIENKNQTMEHQLCTP